MNIPKYALGQKIYYIGFYSDARHEGVVEEVIIKDQGVYYKIGSITSEAAEENLFLGTCELGEYEIKGIVEA